MGFKGVKSDEVLEQEMFSVLNKIIKRGFYSADEQRKHRVELREFIYEYLMDYDHRPKHD